MIHPYNLDKPLAALVARLPRRLRPVMVFASFIAAPPVIATILIITIMAALATSNTDLLLTVLIVVLLSPIAELSKFITRRKRPETLYVEQMHFKTYSFPSGHSYISALVFGFLASTVATAFTYSWIVTALLILLIFLVGVSRVYLGAHFPSDVLAGWALAGSIVYVTDLLERQFL